ncbi:hypothetical protein LPN01_09600 [Sphingomonas sp. A2-49]|uniref:phage regulatory CII family protein n=1 Tax=Sphingomonas sp. A2-49 TaxID=1391375 RepID=UPI0021D083EF|nr:phage regulatory CII family protein [Sphingomonas sp. A2-49]MCU6454333.1 hypothetical protein [Sphingomonas sp. A2-49]
MTPEKALLKRATAEMIRGVGGLEAGAGFTRVGKSMLAEYGSPNKADCFAPIDVVADLEPLARERTGWPHVTQALCKAMGGTFVAEPDVPATNADLLSMMSQLSSEFNDATRAVCGGLSDGKWCREDAARLERELDDVIRVAVHMRAVARSTSEGATS